MQTKQMMTVGELAEKMGTTVRTLQFYDKEGLLKPSGHSEGGRRLYTNKDMVKLHQILSMKYLGFSLEDIKSRLISLDTPEQVATILREQSTNIREKIANLTEALLAIQVLQEEIKHMNKVDFNKYAEIIELLRRKNEHYWVIKFFDDRTLAHIKKRFTEKSANELITKWQSLCDEIAVLKSRGETPESVKGQKIAEEWWSMVMEFTGGDMQILAELMKFNESKESWSESWKEKQIMADEFIGKALMVYLQKQGVTMSGLGANEK